MLLLYSYALVGLTVAGKSISKVCVCGHLVMMRLDLSECFSRKFQYCKARTHSRQFLVEKKPKLHKGSFVCDTHIWQIVPVVSPFCPPHHKNPGRGSPERESEGGRWRGKMDPIKSDRIVSLIEQFVSLFCQHHAFAELPGVPCTKTAAPSGAIYFTPAAL